MDNNNVIIDSKDIALRIYKFVLCVYAQMPENSIDEVKNVVSQVISQINNLSVSDQNNLPVNFTFSLENFNGKNEVVHIFPDDINKLLLDLLTKNNIIAFDNKFLENVKTLSLFVASISSIYNEYENNIKENRPVDKDRYKIFYDSFIDMIKTSQKLTEEYQGSLAPLNKKE